MYSELSKLASSNIPFLFYTDFSGKQLHIHKLSELDDAGIKYSIDAPDNSHKHAKRQFNAVIPVSYETYHEKFTEVIEKIRSGETYLLNLTQPTAVESNLSLEQIYHHAKAKFKLHVSEKFICFSPERFVKIVDDRIYTYPMKGTIEADIPDAEKKILENSKEMAEHIMVVDLLRNDLGIVANDIRVDRFRYIDRIHTGNKTLLQVSSQISGSVGSSWRERLGEIVESLLPAGSITGTPKRSTVQIIKAIEDYERGYFTGIFGVYDGHTFDSAVMIRYIEQSEKGLIYKSGGGITLDSDPEHEYQEMLDKVYIP